MKEVTSIEEFKEAITGKAVVDFNADWCGPCQMMRPMLEKSAGESEFEIVGVNIDELPELAEEYGVAGIPCLVKFAEGKEIGRNVGLLPERKLKKFLET